MLLLFVGGVMNLWVIAALTILVLVEKLAPFGAHERSKSYRIQFDFSAPADTPFELARSVPWPHSPLLPDETVGKIDVGQMLFTRYRVLKRVAASLTDTFHAEGAFSALAFDGDLSLGETSDLKRRAEELPRHAAELPREDLSQHLDLRVGRGRVHHEGALAVAFVDCFRPVHARRAFHA